MASNEMPSTSTPYGTMELNKKNLKTYNRQGFTIFKAVETISSLYCSYFIYVFFVHEDTLSIIYISWPVFSIIDFVIILDRLFNFKREANVLVFEVAASFLGYITHTLCAIFLMYLLNQEKHVAYDEHGSIQDPKFLRYIKPAVISTCIACTYLMDCLLSVDSLLNIWGIETWTWPDEPNLQVDLEPNTSLKLVAPWETSLARESILVKFRQISSSRKKSVDSKGEKSSSISKQAGTSKAFVESKQHANRAPK
ncbi:uncharacterized protein [Halyomorpha halys]|nr:uncharacterized protein LOC106687150 isoform X2 [Halyomorpha halys]XP_014286373.1 uncharacterized protein LOC106687150 isoform X2 [Halyomorpha halys]